MVYQHSVPVRGGDTAGAAPSLIENPTRTSSENQKSRSLRWPQINPSSAEDDFGVKERAGDSRRDGNEFALSRKDFDLAGARELQQIDRAPTADVSSRHFVDGDGRKCGKQRAGMDEEFVQRFK